MCTTMTELEKVISEYRSLKTLLDETSEAIRSLELEIIGYLDLNKKVSEIGNNFKITISTCERRTLDSKRLEEDLGSLAEYQRVSQYRRLYVR